MSEATLFATIYDWDDSSSPLQVDKQKLSVRARRLRHQLNCSSRSIWALGSKDLAKAAGSKSLAKHPILFQPDCCQRAPLRILLSPRPPNGDTPDAASQSLLKEWRLLAGGRRKHLERQSFRLMVCRRSVAQQSAFNGRRRAHSGSGRKIRRLSRTHEIVYSLNSCRRRREMPNSPRD